MCLVYKCAMPKGSIKAAQLCKTPPGHEAAISQKNNLHVASHYWRSGSPWGGQEQLDGALAQQQPRRRAPTALGTRAEAFPVRQRTQQHFVASRAMAASGSAAAFATLPVSLDLKYPTAYARGNFDWMVSNKINSAVEQVDYLRRTSAFIAREGFLL